MAEPDLSRNDVTVETLRAFYKTCHVTTLYDLLHIQDLQQVSLTEYLKPLQAPVPNRSSNRKDRRRKNRGLKKVASMESFLKDSIVVFPDIPNCRFNPYKDDSQDSQPAPQITQTLHPDSIKAMLFFLHEQSGNLNRKFHNLPFHKLVNQVLRDISDSNTPFHNDDEGWKASLIPVAMQKKLEVKRKEFYGGNVLKLSIGQQRRPDYLGDFLSTDPLWIELYNHAGPAIMYYLLSCCSIFCNTDIRNPTALAQKAGRASSNLLFSSTYLQVSGLDIQKVYNDLKSELMTSTIINPPFNLGNIPPIEFNSVKLLYRKPLFNNKLKSGLEPNHILNVLTRLTSESKTESKVNGDIQLKSILRDIFPSAHNLISPLVSQVTNTRGQTTCEIQKITKENRICSPEDQIPSQLKGKCSYMVGLLLHNHQKCKYYIMLDNICQTDIHEQSALIIKDIYDRRKGDNVNLGEGESIRQIKDRLKEFTEDEKKEYSKRFLTLRNTHTPNHLIIRFCSCILRKVLPSELIGGQRNWNHLLECMKNFVNLHKGKSVTLKEIATGMNMKEVSWFDDSDLGEHLFLELLYWIFESFLPSLLNTCFYVTDALGEAKSCSIFFFRYDVWSKLYKWSFQEFESDSSLVRITEDNTEKIEKSLGISQIRMVPKIKYELKENSNSKSPEYDLVITSFRPISRMNKALSKGFIFKSLDGKTEGFSGDKQTNINHQLQYLHKALQGMHKRKIDEINLDNSSANKRLRLLSQSQPSIEIPLIGTIRSSLDLFDKILAFKQKWESLPPLYFVKIDIQKCFDTIPQDIAIATCRDLLCATGSGDYDHAVSPQNQYQYRKQKVVTIRNIPHYKVGKLSRLQKQAVRGTNVKYPFTMESLSCLKSSIERAEVISKSRLSNKIHSSERSQSSAFTAIVLDCLSANVQHTAQEYIDQLESHINNNLVYFQGRFCNEIYHQKVGIPQGSVLSTLLCNLVYEQLEQEIFSLLPSDYSKFFLCRFTDDFLFVSTEQNIAEEFLKCMTEGFLEYGAQINPEKTLVNFKPKDQTIQHVLLEPNGIMPYIGIGIKMDKLELLRNMNASVETTFFQGIPKEKIIFKRSRRPFDDAPEKIFPAKGSPDYDNANRMIDKMVYHASSKLTRPFVDPRINQWDTILQNVKFISAIMAKYIAFALHIHWGYPESGNAEYAPNSQGSASFFEPDQLNGVTINQRTVKKVFVAVISKILSIVTGCNFLRIDQKTMVHLQIADEMVYSLKDVRNKMKKADKLLEYAINYLEASQIELLEQTISKLKKKID